MLKVCCALHKLIVICFFLWLCFDSFGQGTDQEEQRIAELLSRLERENRTVEELIAEDLTNLPVGIKRTVANTTVIIAVDSAIITLDGMVISAYTQVTLPGSEKLITLAAKNILLTPSGISQSAESRLVMISNCKIPLSDQVSLSLTADGQNYIEWDCNGFRSMNISGLFEFSNQFFTPDPELSGNMNSVIARLEVNTTDLNNILVSTSITPFRIKGLGDMAFVVNNAVADMSDFINSDGFAYPAGYQNIFPDAPGLWRGFFLRDLLIYLPSELSGSSERRSVGAHNILIDESGVSGLFTATNILPLNQGSASGWPFSINSISIGLTQNRLSGGALEGSLSIPFLGNDTLGYTAQVESSLEGLQYYFAVATNTSRNFNMPLGGTLTLDRGSVFIMETRNGKFIPSAILNGSLNIDTGQIKAEGLRFERLHITAESPYIIGGTFASAGEIGYKIAGFGFNIDEIALGVLQGRALLEFKVDVALMNRDDRGVGASTTLILSASVVDMPVTENSLFPEQKWQYSGTQIEEVKVWGEISIFKFDGNIAVFQDHPVYGNGFHGNIGLKIEKVLDETAEVEIYFGTKDDFRYWFTRIDVPANIPLGAITLKKLAGGAYNKMRKQDLNALESVYIPDANSGLGFIAQVGLCVKNEKIFYADALFEIAFTTTGGVRYIRFIGDGQFFSGSQPTEPPPVRARIVMVFDRQNAVFHANLQVHMNLANAIKGVGPDGLLGEAVIHADPQNWYIYIGRPSLPLGVNVLGLATVQTYFMAGTIIEDMPLPPSEVASILGNIDMDFMQNESAISEGGGVAFGLQFKANFGFGQNSGFVYAYMNAGAGADIMLRNYGTIQCEGRSGPIGIDGWYASGQGYAYLQGKIGIRARRMEFDIMNVAAALLLQAKMPNPAWFRGNIAARYSILGGLIKGRVNLEVILGEECVIVTNGNELGELKLIGDISPAEGDNVVDVFAAPQVAFNTNIDREFGMMNIADQYAVYRVKLDDYKLVTSDNQSIAGTIQWNNERDMAVLKALNTLPGNQQISALVKVHIEKKTTNGWEALKTNGVTDYEIKEARFTTGEEPKSIPDHNVAYSYPLKNQYNFYKSEYPKGYIKLKSGQETLFKPESDGTMWNYIVRFKTSTGIVESPVTYSINEAMVNFNIPGTLSNSVVYEMTIIKKPSYAGTIDRNLERGVVNIATSNANDTLSLAQNQLEGTITAQTETNLHSFSFRTSMFSTFSEKLNSLTGFRNQSSNDTKHADTTKMRLLYNKFTLNETFDKYETEGNGPTFGSLVFAEALRGTPWIDSHVYPQIYEFYGTAGITLNRNTNELGVFPSKAMAVFNVGEKNYLLNGTDSSTKQGDVYFGYYVPHYIYTDFSELRNKAASLYLDKSLVPPQAQLLLEGSINNVWRGSYPYKISYRLPGLNIITTTKDYSINYGVD